MRISYKWLQHLVDIDVVSPDVEEIGRTLTAVGLAVEAIEELDDDWALELEVPSNRPDCLSHLGVARELAAFYGLKLHKPEFAAPGESLSVEHYPAVVEIIDGDLCPRYAGRVLTDVRIEGSPDWLKERLEAIGQRPINNVVDITNYVLMEIGQPLHAFDYEKLEAGKIVVRRARQGEVLVTLDGEERRLNSSMLAICDSERATALAGVMGGFDSEISEDTTTLLLESAYFDPASIRSTAQALRFSTEASYRFERGADPEVQVRALNLASRMIEELAGGRCVGPVIDVVARPYARRELTLTPQRIKQVCGIEMDPEFVRRTLVALEFELDETGPPWKLRVPGFRPDIELEDDLVEEVLRHYGYDRIEGSYPQSPITGRLLDTDPHDRVVTETLTGFGFSEAINLVFSTPEQEEVFWGRIPEMVPLSNPLTAEDTHLRLSQIPGLVKSVRRNLNHGAQDVRLFEIGHVYHPGAEKIDEKSRLAFIATGEFYEPYWRPESDPFDFSHLKGVVQELIARLGGKAAFEPSQDLELLQPGLSARVSVGGERVGFAGRLHPRIEQAFKFRKPVLVGELSLDTFYASPLPVPAYQPLGRFPSVARDLSFVVDKRTEYATIENGIKALNIPDLRDIRLIDFYQGPKLSQGKVGLTVRMTFADPGRTLTQEEVTRHSEQVFAALQSSVGVELRS